MTLRPYLLFVSLALGAAVVDAAEPALRCRQAGDFTAFSLRSGAGLEVTIAHLGNICDAGFSYDPEPDRPSLGLLRLAPRELGLNASNEVIRVDFGRGTAVSLGEIPASAERVAPGVYRNIVQQGGSLLQEQFVVNATTLRAVPRSLELVFDGDLCLDTPDAIYQRGMGAERSCGRWQAASMTEPICLEHRDRSHRVVSLSHCRLLVKRLRQS